MKIGEDCQRSLEVSMETVKQVIQEMHQAPKGLKEVNKDLIVLSDKEKGYEFTTHHEPILYIKKDYILKNAEKYFDKDYVISKLVKLIESDPVDMRPSSIIKHRELQAYCLNLLHKILQRRLVISPKIEGDVSKLNINFVQATHESITKMSEGREQTITITEGIKDAIGNQV